MKARFNFEDLNFEFVKVLLETFCLDLDFHHKSNSSRSQILLDKFSMPGWYNPKIDED